jgi:hypothetical protein
MQLRARTSEFYCAHIHAAQFLSRLTFQAPHALGLDRAQLAHETFYGLNRKTFFDLLGRQRVPPVGFYFLPQAKPDPLLRIIADGGDPRSGEEAVYAGFDLEQA